jgi:hypothetical protein
MTKYESNRITTRLFKKLVFTSEQWEQLQLDFVNREPKNYVCAMYGLKSSNYRALKTYYS